MDTNDSVRTVAGQHGAFTPEHKALVAELREIGTDWRRLAPIEIMGRASKAAAAIESLSAQGEADAEPMIPRAENCGRYLAEVNDGRLLYLNHANTWQECPNFITHPAPAPVPDAVEALDQLEAIIHDLAGEVAPNGPEDRAWAIINQLRSALASNKPVGDGPWVTVRVEDTCDGLLIHPDDAKKWNLEDDRNYPGHFLPDGRYRISLTASGEAGR